MITAIVTLLSYAFSKEPKRVPWTAEIVVLFLLNAWFVFCNIFAFYPDLAWTLWDKVWKIQLMTLVTIMLITDRQRLHWLVWAIALSLGYTEPKEGYSQFFTEVFIKSEGRPAHLLTGTMK